MIDPEVIETGLDGPILVKPAVHEDSRGFFLESYRANLWREIGVGPEFVQQNHSRSARSTLRGIHFQTEPGQAKLVRCARGRIFDVAVDLRSSSSSFGEWEGFVLDDESHHQLFIPVGFGHGFCVLSEEADVTYLVSSYFDPETEAGIRWDDPDVGVDWPVDEPIISDRDREAPTLAEIAGTLPF